MVGGFKHLDYFPFHIWDVMPTPLTFTPSFFKMVKLHHQAVFISSRGYMDRGQNRGTQLAM